MKTQLLIAARMTVVTLLLTGFLYPAIVTALAQVLFSHQANGSLIEDQHGTVIGSEFVAQGFANAAYVQPRPSAAGNGYDALSSGGSNFGPTSQKLHDRVAAEVDRLLKDNPDAPRPVPADLVTTSASGLDPELSPGGARWQAPRIAQARGIAKERVLALIDAQVEGRDLGFLGEPRVNVLRLNLALDRQFGRPKAATAANGGAAPDGR